MNKDLYYLYDVLARNVTMVGIYDSAELAFRDFHYFLSRRGLNIREFAVFHVASVEVADPDYNADLRDKFYSFDSEIKKLSREAKENG